MPRKPVEQERYESKHQDLLAQQERVHGGMSWLSSRTLAGGVFLLLAHCEHKELLSLQRIGMVPWPLCLFNRGDGAVRGTLCFSLPYSREITHF